MKHHGINFYEHTHTLQQKNNGFTHQREELQALQL